MSEIELMYVWTTVMWFEKLARDKLQGLAQGLVKGDSRLQDSRHACSKFIGIGLCRNEEMS